MIVLLSAIIANVSQFGLLLTFKTITPDFGKINPLKGIKNKFSLKTVMMGVMNLAKTALIAWISYAVLSQYWTSIFRLTGHDSVQGVQMFAKVFFQLSFFIVLAMLILALADFAYQKWQNNQSMKM